VYKLNFEGKEKWTLLLILPLWLLWEQFYCVWHEIQKIADVKIATLETNGQIGYELIEHARLFTIDDLEKMFFKLAVKQMIPEERSSLFKEMRLQKHDESVRENLH
jgi:uncharacterized membrane protein YcaP (DUF421 family)